MKVVWHILVLLPVLVSCLPVSNGPNAFVHPIEVSGKHFVDSVTQERFLINGIDYQPGGASSYTKERDPLSDEDVCARDIYLFQQLGINTIRVYTINPQLNHDACMTMLAAANIYLLLDVNSPLVGESINRYEPWTTYTPDYLRHVFEVAEQFSRYNNTLGFFIGNEIINDERSASVSPPYIKAVTRDVKDYMYYNCVRLVPLGYSAADDLRYREQLSNYLLCGESETAVDFYGVNSYQWCGQQTMKSSGYDVLIKDHSDFQAPVFLSEFGCNQVLPRSFQEVSAIFSPEMTSTFSGGLVYEFTQEKNEYGLVRLDESGNAILLDDFDTLQKQLADANAKLRPSMDEKLFYSNRTTVVSSVPYRQAQKCLSSYPYLSGARLDIPESFGTDMIRNGVRVEKGRYLQSILDDIPRSPYEIYAKDGKALRDAQITVVNNFSANIDRLPGQVRGGFRYDGGSKTPDDTTEHGSSKKQQEKTEDKKSKHEKTKQETSGSSTIRPLPSLWYVILGLFQIALLS